ncbi:MAG: ECF transporter S component [Clostridia bacterium]|nr:ECF transporter S component [Clostridia bacterium]
MNKTKKLVIAALFASLVCVATMIIKIPSFQGGYVNLGDSIVLVCAWFLSPGYAFAAAAIGSGLADLFAGYVLYAPVTFAIKGLMALLAYFVMKSLRKKSGEFLSASISAVCAELLMVVGYFVFEVFLYGAYASLMNAAANCVQAVAGIVVGILLYNVFRKSKLF